MIVLRSLNLMAWTKDEFAYKRTKDGGIGLLHPTTICFLESRSPGSLWRWLSLSLSCYHAGQWACVFSLPYKTHKARNGHKRKSGGGGIGYFTFLLTHSHFLYLALPLLHLAIQLTKSWPRMGGQTS